MYTGINIGMSVTWNALRYLTPQGADGYKEVSLGGLCPSGLAAGDWGS